MLVVTHELCGIGQVTQLCLNAVFFFISCKTIPWRVVGMNSSLRKGTNTVLSAQEYSVNDRYNFLI